MKEISIDEIIEDILSFFHDNSKTHWIYEYRDNKNTNVNGKSVFYSTQLKILFENKYHHWSDIKL